MIADFAHISVGAKLGGNVHIGKQGWIGIGGVVVKDINKAGVYIGILAKSLKERNE